MTLRGISQTPYQDSSTTIPNYQLKKAINLIENGKVVKHELNLSKQTIELLQNRISKKDSVINQYMLKELVWRSIEQDHKKEKLNNYMYMENSQKIFEKQRFLLNSNKFQKWAFLALGIGLGFAIHK
jgi:hypothetical protein